MARKKGQISRVLVGILMLLLIVGLAGFGATNFGGHNQSIGTVGDSQIDINRYYRSLNEELRALQAQSGQNITLSQARQFGVDQAVLQRLIGTVALENETREIGISVGDTEVQRQLLGTPAFAGLDGSFDKEAYEFALQNAGMNSTEYEDALRVETASDILQAAVINGVATHDSYGDLLIRYLGERRDFGWLELGAGTLESALAEPTESELRAYFSANGDDFMVPAAKRITYAWLSPDTLIDTISLDEATLQSLYDERASEYNLPERRLVERLVYPSVADAGAAAGAIANGSKSFEMAATERGLSLADIDLGDVNKSDLGSAGDAVFAINEPGVVGPVETSLGPALFRVNAILAAQVTSFEDARSELADEVSADAARRAVSDQIADFEDLLAGGATLEQLADETDMVLGQIDWTAGNDQGIAGYAGFVTQAEAVTATDFPQIEELEDGSIFTIRLDEELAERPDSFENARAAVGAAWRAAALDAALNQQAAVILAELDAGARLSSLGYPVQVQTHVTRDSFIEGAAPEFVEKIFAADPGANISSATIGRVFIAHLDAVLPPDTTNEDIIRLQSALDDGISQSLGQDVLESFVRTLYNNAGININQAAINAVHAQFP